MKRSIYLDYAAATPVDDGVLRAMQPFWQADFYNPSATYLAGRRLAEQLRQIRQQVAGCLAVRPSEIIFTAGGSEADNLAIYGVMSRLTEEYPKANLVISAIEHEAVLQAAEPFRHKLAPVTPAGRIDLDKLAELIDDETVLVSLMHANNELGTIQPLAEVSRLLAKIRQKRQRKGNPRPLYLHSDASQTANYLAISPSRLGVDLLTLNGGKLYGPKQTGCLFVRAGLQLTPLIRGGGQEHGWRSGTQNLAGAAGFAKAVELAQDRHKTESARLKKLRELFVDELAKAIPSAVINGRGPRLPNIVHLTIPGTDNERLMMELDEAGIMCAVGSACSASSDEPSHVLRAIGLSEAQARSSLRFSMGRSTTKADILKTVKTLASLV